MPDPLRILVLGGTAWLGRRTAELARVAGHDVTCLARGASGDVPDGVALVRADRDDPAAYDALTGTYDAAVEVSWQPEHVRGALAALADRVGHWVYVSSVSVYADLAGLDDTRHAPWTGTGEAGIEDYGPAKVACEDAYADALPADRFLLARAGLIGGHGDGSDRSGYWPARVARAVPGEQVLTPPATTPFQVVDVDDLAAWLLDAAVRRTAGAHDAVGDPQTFAELMPACVDAAGTEPAFVEVDEERLVSAEVRPWSGPESLPLWIPGSPQGISRRSNAGARSTGLTVRPLAETVAAALRWEQESGLDRDRRSGLSSEREAALLRALSAPGTP